MKCLHLIIFISLINLTLSSQTIQNVSEKVTTEQEIVEEFQQNKLNYAIIQKTNISDIKIYFYSRGTTEDGIQVDLTDSTSLKPTDFNKNKTTIFLVHGWHDDRKSTLDREVKNAYLSVQDANVFVVDWSIVASENYISAFLKVSEVGQLIGELINDLVKYTSLSMEKIIIVGHSMGAHVAGVAAATIEGQAEILIGLDPAGPLFTMGNKDNRIDSSEAKFVQIIHTNAGIQGWNQELGHADYWPNGGHSQPGCIDDILGGCAHARSVLYLAESIRSGNFIAKKCKDWKTYEDGDCSNGTTSWLGQNFIDTQAAGNYYLKTNDQSPFAKG